MTRRSPIGVVADAAVVALAVVTALGAGSSIRGRGSVVGTRERSAVRDSPDRRSCGGCSRCSLATAGAVRSQHELGGPRAGPLGAFEGWVRIVDDPQPYPSSTRVIVEVEGERFETVVARPRAAAAGDAVARWRVGPWSTVSNGARSMPSGRTGWRGSTSSASSSWTGRATSTRAVRSPERRIASERDRAGRRHVDSRPDGALYRGLVIGDDRDQPRDMIDRFRASGLSHLTAVSGQNVAFVLAACGPLLVRMRPGRGGRHAGGDRLVRGAHPVRTVDPACRGDGRAVGHRLRTGRERSRCGSWRSP
jgi:hypothetical protein